MNKLNYKIFPSQEETISVRDNEYGGAHSYVINNSIGFSDGVAKYLNSTQEIVFCDKREDGEIEPGLHSEQLAYILLDRCVKLNRLYPSDHNAKMIAGLDIFLDACRERVEERIERGVMGELKK